jgi:hypothetical protein
VDINQSFLHRVAYPTPIDFQADNHTNKKPRSLANTIPCEIVVSVMEAWGLEPMTSMQCSHRKRLKTLFFQRF